MNPADSLRPERSNPYLILGDGLFHAWHAAALCPYHSLAIRQVSEGELADSRLPNAIEGSDIGRIGKAKVQGLEHDGLMRHGKPECTFSGRREADNAPETS